MLENVDLRKALDEATKLRFPDVYKAAIERLRHAFGHNITVCPHDYGPYNRNEPEPSCYALALDLANNTQYLQLVAASLGPGGKQPINSKVVMWLLEMKVLRRRRAGKRLGDVVLYFRNGEPKHAG